MFPFYGLRFGVEYKICCLIKDHTDYLLLSSRIWIHDKFWGNLVENMTQRLRFILVFNWLTSNSSSTICWKICKILKAGLKYSTSDRWPCAQLREFVDIGTLKTCRLKFQNKTQTEDLRSFKINYESRLRTYKHCNFQEVTCLLYLLFSHL